MKFLKLAIATGLACAGLHLIGAPGVLDDDDDDGHRWKRVKRSHPTTAIASLACL